jgi:hypothetical protein
MNDDVVNKVMESMSESVSSALPNRAKTDDQKRECLEKILEVWKKFPELRLGQLLVNAINTHSPQVFYIEDVKLSEKVVQYGEKWESSHSSKTENESGG